MLTIMTEEDWTIVSKVFEASRSRRGDNGRNDQKSLEALQYFVVHNITWRQIPAAWKSNCCPQSGLKNENFTDDDLVRAIYVGSAADDEARRVLI
jgi:hypothetical protein